MIYRRTQQNQPIPTSPDSKEKYGGRIDVSPPSNSIFLDDEEQEHRQQHAATRGYYYLTPRAQSELPGYQYSGKDCSLVYKYILAPLASFCVNNLTPRWVAPNVITLLGLGLMGLSYSFMWYYCPRLDEGLTAPDGVPRWIFLYNCVAMLCYQTLDNMDGRQARRTKSTSPLGLLFDHGCDAMNALPGSVNWAVACGLGFSSDPIKAWFVISCPLTLFFITTWEEYYTHSLIMPIVNGASEGLIAGASFSLISYLWGVHYWHSTTWFDGFIEPYISQLPSTVSTFVPDGGITNVDLIFALCVFWLIQEESLKFIQVGRKYGAAALENLLPYLFLMAASTYIGACFPDFLARNTRVCLHLVCALFSEMSIQLMIDHMCNEKYDPYRLTLAPLGVLIVVLHTSSVSDSFLDEYVLIYSVAAWTYLIMKLRVLVNEICSLLRIWCFDIVTPYPAPKVVLPRLN